LRGNKSPRWKGGKKGENQIGRCRLEHTQWRKVVFTRDGYTCQKCGDQGGHGHRVILNAHHIKHWAKHPELRYDINNGITLCKKCHLLEHNHKF
jgi:5-methylcytosine-specific restriction endonuclease McrA